MRTVFATTLTVNDPADSKLALNMVSDWIRAWYDRYKKNIRWPDEFSGVFLGSAEAEFVFEPDSRHRVIVSSVLSTAVPVGRLIDLSWDYPDIYDQTLGWSTKLTALQAADKLIVAIEVSVKGLTFQILPASVRLGAPRLVKDISRLRSVYLGAHPYNLAAQIVPAEDIEALTTLLLDERRVFPVVVVSRQLTNERPLVDSLALAGQLAGTAQVFELEDRWSAFALTEIVGKELSCYGGAVRLYWPRFAVVDDPYRHRSWMPWSLADDAGVAQMVNALSAITSEASAFRYVEPPLLTQARTNAQLKAREARREENPKEVDAWIEDVEKLEDLLQRANAELSGLRAENITLKDNVAALTTATYAAPLPAAIAAPQPAQAPAEPQTVRQAVEFAQAQTKHLEFLPMAFESAEESPYKKPERALEALLAIDRVANQWLASLDAGTPSGSNRDHFKKLGFDYANGISQTSQGKWGDEYKAVYNGVERDISQHITIGAKQADTCLSVHMAWLKDERKVLIAHVGRHKTNTRT